MNKKVLTLSAVMASMLCAAAHAADTRIGVTIYKYDDNFMSVVRKAIEKMLNQRQTQLLMNDSQNDQSKQNDQIDVLLAKGVKALAINPVDPAAAGTVIEKARGQNVPIVFFNKEPSRKALDSYDKAYYVGTDSKSPGLSRRSDCETLGGEPKLGSEQRWSDSVRSAERRTGPSGC